MERKKTYALYLKPSVMNSVRAIAVNRGRKVNAQVERMLVRDIESNYGRVG